MAANYNPVQDKGDHVVIDPQVSYHHLVINDGTDGFDFEAIARAEKALEQLSEEFGQWMEDEINVLHEARKKVTGPSGIVVESLDGLFYAAHDIKGQAKTFGFPMAALVASSLCRLIEDTPDSSRIPVVLVDQHIDAIRAMVRIHQEQSNPDVAKKLSHRLAEVTEKFLELEIARNAPAETAGAGDGPKDMAADETAAKSENSAE